MAVTFLGRRAEALAVVLFSRSIDPSTRRLAAQSAEQFPRGDTDHSSFCPPPPTHPLFMLLPLQLPETHTNSCDNISQFSVDSITSLESKEPVFIAAGDIRSEYTRYSHVQKYVSLSLPDSDAAHRVSTAAGMMVCVSGGVSQSSSPRPPPPSNGTLRTRRRWR